MIFRVLLIALAILWGGFARATEQPLDVSLVQLIATPERYDGKLVRCIGFLRLEFEGNGLYLHREDYEQSLNNNGVWIVAPSGPAEGGKSVESLNLHYVLVEGVFDASNKGHMGMWSGTLKKIRRLREWGLRPLLPAK